MHLKYLLPIMPIIFCSNMLCMQQDPPVMKEENDFGDIMYEHTFDHASMLASFGARAKSGSDLVPAEVSAFLSEMQSFPCSGSDTAEKIKTD